MSFVAHTGMFHKKTEVENQVTEELDNNFANIIKKVILEKTTVLHKTPQNVYVISYSENGPFQNNSYIQNEWLPIHIYKMKEWHSGGIRTDEFETQS